MALLYDQHTGRNYPAALRTLPERGLFDEFFSYQANQDDAPFWSLIGFIPQIRRKQFDSLVYLAPRFRSKRQIWRDLIFFRLAGIKRFIGNQGMMDDDKLAGKKPLPYLDQEADHLLSHPVRSGVPVPQWLAEALDHRELSRQRGLRGWDRLVYRQHAGGPA